MSRNIYQVYQDNPITSNNATDLMYFGRSPYGLTDDTAMQFSDFASQFGAAYTASALSKIDDTNVTLTLGGSPLTALLQPTSLTLGWTGTLSGTRGGTGVNNGASTITLGGSLSTIGAFTSAFTMTGNTNVTFPTSGTLATVSQIPIQKTTYITSTSYNVLVSDGIILVDTLTIGAPSSIVLPAAPTQDGQVFTIKDYGGAAELYPITITASGGGFIDTNTSCVLNNDLQSASIAWSSSELNYSIVYDFFTEIPVLRLTGDTGVANPNIGGIKISGGTTGLTTAAASSTVSLTGILIPANGGTGDSSFTAYAPICGGTTTTGALQSTTLGGSGTLMQSAGTSSIPTFTTATYPSVATSSGTILRANGTNWVASTSTFADTYAASTLLYSNGTNTVTGLATANSAALITNSSGVPAWSSTMTNGQLIIGNTGGTPTAAALTAGTGITITNSTGSITVTAKTGGMNWSTISGASQACSVNNGYIANNAGVLAFTLPGSCAIGDTVAIEGLGAGGWSLSANTSQTIKIGSSTTSSAGSLASVAASDNVYVTCIVASTTWRVRTTNSAGLTIA